MNFRVLVLPRAERDSRHVFEWIAERSPEGALRWWRTLEQAVQELQRKPMAYALAPENADTTHELRQFLFKTPRGRTYRGVFTVVGEEVRILRDRGPGQAPLAPDELREH